MISNHDLLIGFVVFLAFGFDFVNGFHDAANAIATIVATRVLTPLQAVSMSAGGNFIGMFFGLIFGVEIAKTIGEGLVDTTTGVVDVWFILAVLVGAISWDIITWIFGLPTSSSHALVGGVVGAGVVAAGFGVVLSPETSYLILFFLLVGLAGMVGSFIYGGINKALGIKFSSKVLLMGAVISMVGMGVVIGQFYKPQLHGLTVTIIFMVLSPLIGMGVAFLLTAGVVRRFRRYSSTKINIWFRKLQIISSFFYSVMHGTSDAQKVMGIIALLLFSEGYIATFDVPIWVAFGCHASISLGTFFGGWRIVKTMAQRITKLRPYQGFCAETGGGLVLMMNAIFGIPVSTTHVISSSIIGVGSTRSFSAVRWGVARTVIWAWVLTIPASALVAGITYAVVMFAQGFF